MLDRREALAGAIACAAASLLPPASAIAQARRTIDAHYARSCRKSWRVMHEWARSACCMVIAAPLWRTADCSRYDKNRRLTRLCLQNRRPLRSYTSSPFGRTVRASRAINRERRST
jgi:hypothetical protein